jgi:nucleoside-diphosphate-sugar epimerase
VKRVIVTGASGFIGRHSLRWLIERDYAVDAVTRSGTGSPSAPEGASINWHRADLHDPAARRDLIAAIRPTHLLHFAWCTEHGEYWSSPANLDWVATSLALVREFADAGGERAAVAGSCAEYEWTGGDPLSERGSRIAPGSLYGVAKDSLRRVLAAWAGDGGPSLAWGRVFWVYGPGEDRSRLVPSIAVPLLAGEPARLANGHLRRDYVYVEDVARAFVALLDSDVQGPVNIASGKAIELGRLAERIAEEAGNGDLLTVDADPGASGESLEIVADTGRLNREVGYETGVELDDGIARAVASWR